MGALGALGWQRDSARDEVRKFAVLAYNEWSPLTVTQLMAAFVLPNHPVIAELLGHARLQLERLTKNPGLVAHATGEGKGRRRRDQVEPSSTAPIMGSTD